MHQAEDDSRDPLLSNSPDPPQYQISQVEASRLESFLRSELAKPEAGVFGQASSDAAVAQQTKRNKELPGSEAVSGRSLLPAIREAAGAICQVNSVMDSCPLPREFPSLSLKPPQAAAIRFSHRLARIVPRSTRTSTAHLTFGWNWTPRAPRSPNRRGLNLTKRERAVPVFSLASNRKWTKFKRNAELSWLKC